MKVKLESIVEGMEMQSEDHQSYLNVETGEIVYASRDSLLIAEEGEDYDHLSEWQQEEVKIAIDIVECFGKYAALPTPFEINEYKMMENFCYSLADVKMQDILLNSIRGKGAFRRFKDNILRLGITDEWYDYRDTKYKEIAARFCDMHLIRDGSNNWYKTK